MVSMVSERREGCESRELTAFVFNIMRFATHDGPGIRTTVFLKGCPLACWWCHNPESQSFLPERLYFEERCRHCLECADVCPERAIQEVDGVVTTSADCTLCGMCTETCMAEARQIAGRRYTVGELIAEVERDLVFYDESGGGVTLSGGEPLSHPVFVTMFLADCRERGINTVIETCGFAQSEVFDQVTHQSDLVLFDLKVLDAEKHLRHTGVSNERILRNLESLVARRHPVTVRIPVIPGINDSKEDINDFANYLGRLQPPAVELLPYHSIGASKYGRLGMTYKLPDTPQPAPADLAHFRDELARVNLHVTVGG